MVQLSMGHLIKALSWWPQEHLWHRDIYMRSLIPLPWVEALFVLPKPAISRTPESCNQWDTHEQGTQQARGVWILTTEAPSPRTALSANSGTGSQEGRPTTCPSCSHISDNRTGFGAVPLITPVVSKANAWTCRSIFAFCPTYKPYYSQIPVSTLDDTNWYLPVRERTCIRLVYCQLVFSFPIFEIRWYGLIYFLIHQYHTSPINYWNYHWIEI